MKLEVTGSGETVVLVPGGLTGWVSWAPHAKQLSADHKVVRVQLLSVDLGLQNKPLPEDYSVTLETDALMRALNKAGIAKADFVAWSYGAEIALDFALNHPDFVRTLTLIEPPAIWVMRSRGPLSNELLEEQKRLQSIDPYDVTESELEWFSILLVSSQLPWIQRHYLNGLNGSAIDNHCVPKMRRSSTKTTYKEFGISIDPCCW